MSARGWWWQRFHPVWRAIAFVVYFGGTITFMVLMLRVGLDGDGSGRVDTPPQQAAEPIPVQEESASENQQFPEHTGAHLYETHCSACHGPALEGGSGIPLDSGSEAAENTDSRIVKRIAEGKNDMPSFSGILTDGDIEQLLSFIREQQGL